LAPTGIVTELAQPLTKRTRFSFPSRGSVLVDGGSSSLKQAALWSVTNVSAESKSAVWRLEAKVLRCMRRGISKACTSREKRIIS
jgi:hypothetical protein